MELIKNAVRVGNGAGVLLPRRYLNSRVKVILEPLNIEKDVFEILLDEGVLKEVVGIYVVGSYARGEGGVESDVDVLVVTSGVDKRIVRGRYEIICVSKKSLERQLRENAFPILSMIREARVVMNKELLDEYVGSSLTLKNLKWHLDTTKSALKFVEKDLEISGELGETKISDGIAYSLVLRLRTLYLIDCVRGNKKYSRDKFLKLVKRVGGSLVAYEGYLRAKGDKKDKSELAVVEAEKLVGYISKEVVELERWLKGKRG